MFPFHVFTQNLFASWVGCQLLINDKSRYKIYFFVKLQDDRHIESTQTSWGIRYIKLQYIY